MFIDKFKHNGFTLIELLVAMSVFIFLSTLVTINIINVEPRMSLNSQITTLIADIRNQQLKAMTGGTDNDVLSDFGVYLESDKYTLFSGISYQIGKTNNSVIKLADNMQISNITFPGSTIIFQKESGEIISGGNSFSVRNSISGEIKSVTFNKLGVVTLIE